MRNCIDEGTLQTWFDGELPANEAANVAAHLNGCLQCAEAARTVEAENRIVSEGLATEFAAAIPTERLRQRIETAVAALHDASVPTVSQSRWRVVREFFSSFRPLAYASIASTILLAGFIGFVYLKRERATAGTAQNNSQAQNRSPGVLPAISKGPTEQPRVPAPSVSPKIKKVRGSNVMSRSRAYEAEAMSLSWQERQYDYAIAKLNEAIKIQPPMRPSLQVEYEYNMALIDNAIAASRDAARKNPKDPQAAQFMLAAYQSKVDLMNQIANARVLQK
jgi:hypothetical protein